MFARICPVCKTKFFSEDKCVDDDSFLHSYCYSGSKNSEEKKDQKLVRTSTPVAELEESPTLSFSDSVTDFFYQSWKSGLHLDDTATAQGQGPSWDYHPCTVLQPVCYAPQVLCVNTVIFQPYLPISYMQQVGYRPDGTFGLLFPTFGNNLFTY